MKSKIYTIALTLCLLFVNSFYQIIVSCAGGGFEGYNSDYGQFILSQRMLDDDKLSPFFLMYNSYMAENVFMGLDSTGNANYQTLNYFDDKEENISEWKKYFKTASNEEISQLIYGLKPTDLTQIELFFQLKTALPSNISLTNKAINQVIKKRDVEWLTYMQYAHSCLKYVGGDYTSYNYYWDRNVTPLKCSDIIWLIEQAQAAIITTKNKIIQQRYAFQICRLANYFSVINNLKSDDNQSIDESLVNDPSVVITITQNTESLHHSATKEIAQIGIKTFETAFVDKDFSFVTEWSRAHYASLLRYVGDENNAALENARAFANCPSKRRAAKSAMHYKLDHWNSFALGNKFKNLDDDLNLRALIALDQTASTVNDIVYIGTKNPTHFMIPILLMRELKKHENGGIPYLESLKLLDFCANVKTVNNTKYEFLYQLASGFLANVIDDFDNSETYYTKAYNIASNQLQKDQVKLLTFLSFIGKQDKPTPQFEAKLLQEFQWIDTIKILKDVSENTKLLAMQKLEKVYKNQPVMIYALQSWLVYPDYRSLPNVEKLETIQSYLLENAHSPIEKYLTSQLGITVDEIYEIKATLALARYDYQNAISIFNQMKNKAMIGSVAFDPFKTNMIDCFSCETPTTSVSKLDFAKAMLSLMNIEKSGKATFDTYLKLGNAHYNASYYGIDYDLLDYYRTFSYPYSEYFEDSDISYTNCRVAESYYLKAKFAAKQKSQKALCVYLAAKCARNTDFELSKINTYYPSNNPDFKFTNRDVYFNQLKTQYADTWVNKFALEKCSYYSTYCN